MMRWILVVAVAVGGLMAQSARPEFDVASVKAISGCEGNMRRPVMVPGKIELTCVTLRALIRMAYGGMVSGGNFAASRTDVLGGPAWLDGERFDIAAKAEAARR